MNTFLRKARQLRSLEDPLLLVLGNESCDLDSAISAISLAFFYAQSPRSIDPILRTIAPDRILPVLNVARRLLPTKTEVTYYLRQHQIDLNDVVCRDEIPESLFSRSRLVLVDHHVSPFAAQVLQVIDHRPLDATGAATLPTNTARRIETVGSCCTLIADMILNDDAAGTAAAAAAPAYQGALLDLLYAVIVLDTVNFSPQADRARPLDREVCQRIELLERQRRFDALVAARSDVSGLDAEQLLHKDMKLVHSGSVHVALPGFPVTLRQFAKMRDAGESVQQLAREERCAVIVLLSMVVDVQTGSVGRQVAVIRTEDTEEATQLHANVLRELCAPEAGLDLVELSADDGVVVELLGGRFYQQGNVQASRKQVLPIVQRVLNEWSASNLDI